jgi:hypothetical protein
VSIDENKLFWKWDWQIIAGKDAPFDCNRFAGESRLDAKHGLIGLIDTIAARQAGYNPK